MFKALGLPHVYMAWLFLIYWIVAYFTSVLSQELPAWNSDTHGVVYNILKCIHLELYIYIDIFIQKKYISICIKCICL
jgi:hypothetical protein